MDCPICGTKDIDGKMVLSARKHGKNFGSYIAFIEGVRDGKTAIVMGPEYVVMDRGFYEKLNSLHREGAKYDRPRDIREG